MAVSIAKETMQKGEGEQNNAVYPLPNDAPEAKRLDMQHEIFRITFHNNLYFAPVSSNKPSLRVLDLGCGTSSWGIEIAENNPSASVVGLDLGQPQPEHKPPNYTYTEGNFEQPWPFDASDQQQQFDLIHGRFVLVALRNPKQFIAQALKHLKPGGFFELQDFSVPWRASTPATIKWSTELGKAQQVLGIDMSAATKWDDWLVEAGFENVEHQHFDWPIGVREEDAEQGNEHMCKVGGLVMENIARGMKGFSKIGYTRALGWTEQDLDVWLDEVRQELRSNPGKNVMPLHVIYGQNPSV